MPKTKPEPWAINIVGYELVPPDQLLAHPDNPKIHPGEQRDVMRGMLDEIGFIAPMIVNRRTEHVLDGHMRIEEAITRGQAEVPVMYVDVPEEREPEVLAMFDPIRGLAKTDEAKMALLLSIATTENSHLVSFLATLRDQTAALDQQYIPEISSSIGTVTVTLSFTREQFGMVERVLEQVADGIEVLPEHAHKPAMAVYKLCDEWEQQHATGS